MPKREEVDWAEEIVDGMKKPVTRHAREWSLVKVTCVRGDYTEMSVANSEKIVRGMMDDFFREGPRSAMRAHAEYKAWVNEGLAKGEQRVSVKWHAGQTGEAVSEGLRRWDELRENFENFSDWASGAVAQPANWDAVKGVDFSQVQKLDLKQRPKMRMRM